MRFRITYATHAELAAEVKQMAHGGVLVRDPAAANLAFDTPVVLELVMPDSTTLVSGGKVLQALAGLGVAVTIEPHVIVQAKKIVDAAPVPVTTPPPVAAVRVHTPPAGAPTTPPPARTSTLAQPMPAHSPAPSTPPTSSARPPPSTPSSPSTPIAASRTGTIARPLATRSPAPSTPPTAGVPVRGTGEREGEDASSPPEIAASRTSTLAAPMPTRAPAPASTPPAIAPARTSTIAHSTTLRPPAQVPTAPESPSDSEALDDATAPVEESRETTPPPIGEREPTRAQKIQLALHGTRDQRNAMLRDRDRGLHAFVLKNPGITVDDVLSIAKNAQMSAEIFKQISERADWFQRPQIALALARNPKVPSEIAIRALGHVAPDALRQLAKGAGAPQHVVQAARKRVVGGK